MNSNHKRFDEIKFDELLDMALIKALLKHVFEDIGYS